LTYISLIADDPQGILDQQLRAHPIHLYNIIIIFISYIILLNKKLRTFTTKATNGTPKMPMIATPD
jgi:hypothetical protein